jgi:putative nucleotidyltransferase with HDIG domain
VRIPDLDDAQAILSRGEAINPGPWTQHSLFVAGAAEAIAREHPDLDAETAYVLGLLHDIGRQEGVTDMRHAMDGYRHLDGLGFPDTARICLTHSFPIKDTGAAAGKWDCPAEDRQFVQDYLDDIEYGPYDRLIQLCDALALPSGYCLLEKRLVDVALRHGTNDFTSSKWKAVTELLQEFDRSVGGSIYRLLPGVVENTFGFDPQS